MFRTKEGDGEGGESSRAVADAATGRGRGRRSSEIPSGGHLKFNVAALSRAQGTILVGHKARAGTTNRQREPLSSRCAAAEICPAC